MVYEAWQESGVTAAGSLMIKKKEEVCYLVVEGGQIH